MCITQRFDTEGLAYHPLRTEKFAMTAESIT